VNACKGIQMILKQEIKDRLKYWYGKIDGTYEFPNSKEGDLLHMVHEMLELEGKKRIVMQADGFYGRVAVPKTIFEKLNPSFFISGCTDTMKFMCANTEEKAHLESLGIDVVLCDWYKIELWDFYADEMNL